VPASAPAAKPPAARDPFDMFDMVEAVADGVIPAARGAAPVAAAPPATSYAHDDSEPEEWDEPEDARPAVPPRPLFPIMPSPR
jgi:hypothetical protein